jgi:hypothetical protein
MSPGSRAGAALLVGLLGAAAAGAATLDRPADPVIFTGAEVPELSGIAPGELVAWCYLGGWQQVPVQVDERAPVDLATIYNMDPLGVVEVVYTDAGTFTGADPDPTLDVDDEIVFMARHAGDRPPTFSEPAGVITGSGIEIELSDPLDAGSGYLYLFRQDGSLDPGAGGPLVSYTFDLLSGDYLTTYSLLSGPNPEDSIAVSADYGHHFSDRWIDDELWILAGAGSGVDILDRHKNLFAPGNCSRSEDTFSLGEGAFVANKSGPVRAIRSYLGANSGPLTQRDHLFYERRHDITTHLRVHAIPGVMDFFDYSPSASGMRYRNDLNPSGVTIDGVPDEIVSGALTWELVDGTPGSLVIVPRLETDLAGLVETSYYLDAADPSDIQCTGDAFAYGSSGLWIASPIPCTDPLPTSGPGCGPDAGSLRGRRVLFYLPPGATVDDAAALSAAVDVPLGYSFGPWTDPPGNQPPFVPGDPVPVPGTVGQPLGTTLSWSGGDPDAGDTVLYDVYFGEPPDPPLVSAAQVPTSFDPGPLSPGREYSWRVVAEDDAGAASEGPVWSFHTLTSCELPGTPQDLTLAHETLLTTHLCRACNTISAGPELRIAASADVVFRAGAEIALGSGFSVEAGASFSALNDPAVCSE